ncbi:hypothetical protein KVT40_000439 [Elsinoe batatas]|uniref:Ketoreductase domain-containing protein n=1 Tax=Elsinoe batatas TaxID=2601811 RepID=A0A8K0LA39_9PEZI|nr:hypothetical protein KVT40_000439 [Elsinoe batatas]
MTTTGPLAGKVAIITGASRGIGAATALSLTQAGANVSGIDALIADITTTTSSLAISIQADLSHPSAPAQIVLHTLTTLGPHIDILINNAATISNAPLSDIDPAHFDAIFHLNVRAPLLMLQAVLPHLRRPGRVVNISSIGARAGFAGVGAYSASKAALEGFTRAWAAELGGDGTTVNAVAPGPVTSEMLEQVPEEIKGPQLKATPVGRREGRPEEVAEVVRDLCTGMGWVSGQTICASGGLVMY